VAQGEGAVGVDPDQRRPLVQEGRGERDAELDRHHAEPALGVDVGGVERLVLRPQRRVAGVAPQALQELGDVGVVHRLAVRSELPLLIGVAAAHLQRVQPQGPGDPLQGALDDENPLRRPEAAEGGVGRQVRPAGPAHDAGRRDVVGVVGVEHAPLQDGQRQVHRGAAVGIELHVPGQEAALVVEAHAVARFVRMALAGPGRVLDALERQLRRPAGAVAGQCGQARPQGGAPLLAAEGAAEARHVHGDVLAAPAQHAGGDLLDLGRALGGGVEDDLPVLGRHGDATLRLEVEVLLRARRHLPLQHVRRGGQGGVDVAAGDAALGHVELPPGQRLFDGEHRRQRLVLDADGGRGGLGLPRVRRRHQRHRLADIGHRVRRQERLVGEHVADLVGAGDVPVGEHRGHARAGGGRGGVDGRDPGVGVGAGHHLHMEQSRRPDVLADEARRAGDVEVAAEVRRIGGGPGFRRLGAHACLPHSSALPRTDSRWWITWWRISARRYAALPRTSPMVWNSAAARSAAARTVSASNARPARNAAACRASAGYTATPPNARRHTATRPSSSRAAQSELTEAQSTAGRLDDFRYWWVQPVSGTSTARMISPGCRSVSL